MPARKPDGRKLQAQTKAAKKSSATPPIAPTQSDGTHSSVANVLSWSNIGELEVPRKSPRKTGPQREQKLAKVRAIRKFLDSDVRNIIPSAVIVAFSKGAATFQG